MTKEELKEKLLYNNIEDVLTMRAGQDCSMYKEDKFSDDDNIIYIPDISLNDLYCPYKEESREEYADRVIKECYTGKDFNEECDGTEITGKELFEFVDWQHPNVEDYLLD